MLQKLKEYRKNNNIKVADMLKVMNSKHPITYYRKENGERKFTAEEVIVLSNTFISPGHVAFNLLAEGDSFNCLSKVLSDCIVSFSFLSFVPNRTLFL